MLQITFENVEVGMTHANGFQADQNFPAKRLGDRDLLNLHGPPNFAKYRSFHFSRTSPALPGAIT
jgi:hypothetical protein